MITGIDEKQLFVIGLRLDVEAEYGAVASDDGDYAVLELYDDEHVAIATFKTLAAAKRSVADVPPRLKQWL